MDNLSNLQKNNGVKRSIACCTAASFQLARLLEFIKTHNESAKFFRSGNVVHRSYGANDGDVFYFSYGTIVMWGLSKEEEEAVLVEARFFEEAPIEAVEWEESLYSQGESAKIIKDSITLPSSNVLTKLAFSHGLAQSVKLAVFEKVVERRIEQSRYAPESLAKYGRIGMTRKQLAMMIGQIVLDRNSINFHTDILDTPEFFWEHSDLEPLYRLIAQDLDIVARVNVLNKRLDILKELFEILSNEIENRHSSTLEWIVIILISMEVVVTFAKEIFHLI
jgi:uncharacterized Rmd1/YagE family protein